MTDTHSCPHCGQDLHLPPDALERLEAAERALRFIEDDWRNEGWRNGPLSVRTVNAINAALALKEIPHE